ncbi:MAG TPA: uroporphyrinogen-III synthase [Rhodocyclaceae bacterium]|nr:uroporphyrinogen-III synthase [Rhodocyclaceae bacterium]
MSACAAAPSSLAGKRVLVTRPAAQSQALCAAIRARGGVPECFPLIEIGPCEDQAAFIDVSARLDAFDLAFFVSANAVEHALTFLLARREWPSGLAVATVGKGSERCLKRFGFDRVIAPGQGFDSEAVLALPEFAPASVYGRRVIVFRGNGGREHLGEVLRERGARVEHVVCYQRKFPSGDPRALVAMAAAGMLDAITLTSSEGLRNFVLLLGPEGIGSLCHVPVFAAHHRIAALAQEAGFESVFDTGPGDEGLVHALESQLSTTSG